MSEPDLSTRERELLADLVNGDRGDDDPQVRERIAASPAFAAEVASVRSITTALQHDGALRRGEIAAAGAAVTAADVALARTMIRQHLPRRWRPLWMLTAAAAVVILSTSAWLCSRPGPATDTDPTLGANEVNLHMTPAGAVPAESLRLFQWDDAAGGIWRINVYPARNGRKTGYVPLFPEVQITGGKWQPDTEQIAAMRTAVEFVWELALIRDGEVAVTARTAARCLP